MSSNFLEIQNVTFAASIYNKVNNVSLKIEKEGEIISLLGPSGIGKTTILRTIAGLQNLDAGKIFLKGKVISSTEYNLEPEKRNIALSFQDNSLFPHCSIIDNINFGVKRNTNSKFKYTANDLIKILKLDGLSNKFPHQISAGEAQRVSLARSLMSKPDLLLLDEPLSALDAALCEILRDELAILLREFNITAIFVTHDQDEASAIADRVAVMSDGHIVQSGTPEELYRNPNSAFVAGFVGNAMRLEGKNDGSTLRLVGGELKLPKESIGKNAFVRAESVTINENGTLTGQVENVTFLGNHYRIGIKGIMPSTLTSEYSGQNAPKIGEVVKVAIKAEDIMLLPEGVNQA